MCFFNFEHSFLIIKPNCVILFLNRSANYNKAKPDLIDTVELSTDEDIWDYSSDENDGEIEGVVSEAAIAEQSLLQYKKIIAINK
jgi:hypothetical protein